MPSSVMMALVAGGTLNSSAANLSTAVNGVVSGTLRLLCDIGACEYAFENADLQSELIGLSYTLNGSFGSDVSVILNVTLLATLKQKDSVRYPVATGTEASYLILLVD